MPRHPLLPLLRIGALLTLGALLLWPRRTTSPTPMRLPAGVWVTDVDSQPAGSIPIGEPARPLQGQKRPPCNYELEVEVLGVCWVPHKRPPPCPAGAYEYGGDCLIPVTKAPRPATSIDD